MVCQLLNENLLKSDTYYINEIFFGNAPYRCHLRCKHRVYVININLKLTLSIILKFKES